MSHCTFWVRSSMPHKVFAWGYLVSEDEGTAQQLIQPERNQLGCHSQGLKAAPRCFPPR